MSPSATIPQARRTLEVLAALSYRSGELRDYLGEVARGVSELLAVDWSVVTLCRDGYDRVLASSIDIGEAADRAYALHGTVTGTVADTGQALVVEDSDATPELGTVPAGYHAYLGVPLRTLDGRIIGTICSFHRRPRHFGAEEIRVAELFAERAATAIDNYQLYQQQREFSAALEEEVARRTRDLEAAQARLVEQERLAAIGEFAATIVHEIRSPLTVIAMGLGYLQQLELPQGAGRRIALACEEAGRLERLLAELLLYARPHALAPIDLDLNRVVVETLEAFRGAPCARQRAIEFIPGTTPAAVHGDPDKLRQVLVNLLYNACEAVCDGDRVACAVETSQDGVSLVLHNGGVAIPADVLPRLTEPFFTQKPGGTGLGLAIVKRIVDAHGGRLEIRSAPETGTEVRVLLPAVAVPGPEAIA